MSSGSKRRDAVRGDASRFALMLVALLLITTAAGCVGRQADSGSGPSGSATADASDLIAAEDFAFGRAVDVFLPMADGIELHGTVYLPAPLPPQGVGTILEFSPYFGVIAATDTHQFWPQSPHGDYAHWLAAGYAIAFFSVRGSALSGGCLDMGGKRDQADGAAVVTWLAEQEWSNGNVAMTGYSYPGSTPWTVAFAAPPALKTILPIAGISDWYSYTFRNGTALNLGGFFNVYYPAVTQFAYAHAGDQDRFVANLPTRVCSDSVQQYSSGFVTYASGDHDAYWDERDFLSADRLAHITASVYLIHGLQDWNVRSDQTLAFANVPTAKRALLGQWGHGFPYHDPGYPAWQDTFHAHIDPWLGHFLRGEPLPEAPTVLVEAPDGTWAAHAEWPPASTDLGLELAASGSVLPATMLTPHVLSPDPSRGDDGTQVAFQWTLDGPIHATGSPVVHLSLSADRPHGTLVGHLFDIALDGTWTKVDIAYLDLRHRDGIDSGVDMPMGTPVDVALTFYPQDLLWAEGHRVGLILATADGDPPPHGQIRIKPYTTTMTVHAGTLHLPIATPLPST